jgi:hypothetical protein
MAASRKPSGKSPSKPDASGKSPSKASTTEPSLGQLIRRSPALDVSARRHWLAVLPHLTADDRERLREILMDDAPEPGKPSPPGPLSLPQERGSRSPSPLEGEGLG